MNDLMICSRCIGNSDFSQWICDNGVSGPCEIDPKHTGPQTVVRASDFAAHVDEWFRDNFVRGEMETTFDESDHAIYSQLGDPYADIMAESLQCDPDVIDAIDEHLPDATSRDIAQGDECFYDQDVNYEEITAAKKRDEQRELEYWYENRIYFQWQDFANAAINRRRFFGLKEQLDQLFGDPTEYEGGSTNPVYELPAGATIYRARLIDDPSLVERVNKAPAKELGAPPRDRTKAGRMNVEFIPAFYGAFGENTAVAEIRPGIRETVAIGTFVTQRPVKVFDFTVFSQNLRSGRRYHSHTRFEFITEMEDEISRPILPYDKQREYIPTQIVAEYLAECFGCDAVIYRSAMTRTFEAEGRNIVFLNNGRPFLGESDSPLVLKSHTLKEVNDVQYSLAEEIPF